MSARIEPAVPPFAPAVAEALERLMPPGVPPLRLFATLARDERLFTKFHSAGLLDRGHLTLREREIVILRTTARCGSAYEWGVHVTFFAGRAALGDAEVRSTAVGSADDDCWTERERALVAFCDALHEACDVDDVRYAALAKDRSPEAVLEILMLAGFYRTVSYLTNVLRLPLESFAAPFPDRAPCISSRTSFPSP